VKETIEHNNRFYGEELKTESEQLKEWLKLANEQTNMYKSSFEEMSKNYFESQNEIERLNNIIKEVREWANKTIFYFDFEEEINKHAFDLLYTKQGQELLEILDKVEE
jgi:hypothetical protein